MKNLSITQMFVLGIPILYVLAFLTHFIYDLSGENQFVGLLFPSDESVFQHMKLFTVTGFLFYIIFYILKKPNIDASLWFTSGLISMITIIILIPMLHYFYTQSFGAESVIIDIIISLIVVVMGQLIALHYYNHGKGIEPSIAIMIMLGVIFIFALLTIFPPNIPIFIDFSE